MHVCVIVCMCAWTNVSMYHMIEACIYGCVSGLGTSILSPCK